MLLKQAGTMGPLRLKNRIVMAPMGTNYGTSDGFSTDRDKRYYGERAKGGVAMIVTEAMNVSAGARNHTNSLCVFHDRFIPGLIAVVGAIHDNGALAVAQLNHRGQLPTVTCFINSFRSGSTAARIATADRSTIGCASCAKRWRVFRTRLPASP
jgi:2,4-dienoyl-CoA reductase-like NADH-dependent reductase (Old Yellow Enzyme family)